MSLAAAGLNERGHLQEWVLAHPQMLGADAKIVTFEFDKWASSSGAPSADRLDVLAVDRSGRLIVAELKRDKAPDTVTVQAINYAAMVSRFSLDTLSEAHALHLGGSDRRGHSVAFEGHSSDSGSPLADLVKHQVGANVKHQPRHDITHSGVLRTPAYW